MTARAPIESVRGIPKAGFTNEARNMKTGRRTARAARRPVRPGYEGSPIFVISSSHFLPSSSTSESQFKTATNPPTLIAGRGKDWLLVCECTCFMTLPFEFASIYYAALVGLALAFLAFDVREFRTRILDLDTFCVGPDRQLPGDALERWTCVLPHWIYPFNT